MENLPCSVLHIINNYVPHEVYDYMDGLKGTMMRAATAGITVHECLHRERLHHPFQKTVSCHQFRQMLDHNMVELLDEEIVDDGHVFVTYHDYRGRDEPANSRRLRNVI